MSNSIVERILNVRHSETGKLGVTNNVYIGAGVGVLWEDGTYTVELKKKLIIV